MPLQKLQDLFVAQLHELHAGEAAGIEALRTLQGVTSHPRLLRALQAHEAESEAHAERLEGIFEELGITPRRGGSQGMKGLCADCLELARLARVEPHVRDAAVIAAAQRIEHDEMAGYGCARTWAKLLGHRTIASTLQRSLNEEGRFDAKLSRLADAMNRAAMEPALA
jgi:ferritin-like metal-binding protein YciE